MKRVLVTGGYIVIFINAFSWFEWYADLTKAGFQVMPYPAVFVFDTEVDRETNVFPRSNGEMALIGKLPGNHPKGFIPAFSEQTSFDSATKRNAFYVNVPKPDNRLLREGSKSPVRTSENSVSLLRDLITLYCPLEGTVMDSFAGTCSAAIAALQYGRRVIAIEEDTSCFLLAEARLENIALSIAPRNRLTSNSNVISTTSGKRVSSSNPVINDDDIEDCGTGKARVTIPNTLTTISAPESASCLQNDD